ncbi:RNA polymerase sigma factor [Bacteroidales bacterium]|nr:RNA polymerase sigma factor [Bacteroidales bacterium]
MQKRKHITDKQILEKIKTGDAACFELLYRRQRGKIFNFILKLSNRDFYMAEEILQRVFIRIWEMRKKINADESISSFLYTISKNMFLNEVRSRAQQVSFEQAMQNKYCEAENSVEREVEYKLLEEEVNRLINQLPPARRRIYQLSKQKHMSNKEIAAMLNISENTVESSLYKATIFLRKILSIQYKRDGFIALIIILKFI